jgi:hypothetical protein
MKREYTLEKLSLIFEKHGIEADKNQERLIKEFKENYPNEKIPDHFKDDLNLPLALKFICDEIIKMKC